MGRFFFCASTASADLVEFSMSASPIRRHLTVNDLPIVDGYIDAPLGPGLGVEVNADLLQELSGGATRVGAAG